MNKQPWKKEPTKRKQLLLLCVPLLIVLIAWTVWGNVTLGVSTYTVVSNQLPDSFIGFRIAQVSDFHNAEFGEGNRDLLGKLSKIEPDMIVITGDFVDSRRTDISIALQFAEEAMKIAPCYYVPGNHEARIPKEYEALKAGLEAAGVVLLENAYVHLEVNGEQISLIGVNDPSFQSESSADSASVMAATLETLTCDDATFRILLSHRPELFDIYVNSKVNLVFSGHAHGGQIRLPFVGGLIAPHQGIFPMYDGGLYTREDTSMIVSRGIGNSAFPIRFNNRPEVTITELQQEQVE